MITSLGRGFTVALEELKKSLRHKKKTLGMMVIPLVFIFLLTLGLGSLFEEGLFIQTFSVAVVNEDEHPMAFLLMEQIRGDEGLQDLIEIVEAKDAKEARTLVNEGEVFAGVVIPEDFVGSLERGESRELLLYTGPGDPFKSQVLYGIMESFMYSVSAGQSGVNAVWDYYREQDLSLEERREKIDPVIRDITFRALNARDRMMVHEQVEGINTMDPGVYYVHSVVFSLVLFIGLLLGKELMEEKRSGMFQRVVFTGTTMGEYYGGKVLGHGLRTVFFGGVLLILGEYLFFYDKGFSSMATIGYLSLWVFLLFFFVALGAVVMKDQDVYFTLGNFTVFALILLGGGVIPYYYLPYGLEGLARSLPHYHYLQGIGRITLGDYGSLRGQILGMLLLGTGLLTIGIWMINKRAGEKT